MDRSGKRQISLRMRHKRLTARDDRIHTDGLDIVDVDSSDVNAQFGVARGDLFVKLLILEEL